MGAGEREGAGNNSLYGIKTIPSDRKHDAYHRVARVPRRARIGAARKEGLGCVDKAAHFMKKGYVVHYILVPGGWNMG